MDPLSVTASIIAVLQLTATVTKCLLGARDAPTERTQFTAELSNLKMLLVDLLSHLDESSDEPWHAKVRELGGKDGLIFQYRVALEQLKIKLIDRQGIKNTAKILLWKYIKEDVEDILSRLERLKSLVQIALELDHFTLSRAIESCMKSIHNDTQEIQKNTKDIGQETKEIHIDTNDIKVGVNALQNEQDNQKCLLIMEWLSSADFAAQQADLIRRRQEDTGLWFLASFGFSQWVNGPAQSLFCPGIPGAGKTMMTSIVVDDLQKRIQTPDIGLAFLYCNYNRQAEQTTCNFLSALLKQLIQDRPSLVKLLDSLYERHRSQRTRPTVTEILEALRSTLTNYSRVYLIIDALDECSDENGTRSELLKLCRNLQEQADLRLMVTSRPIPDIKDKCEHMFRMEIRASASDVARYVRGQIGRLPKCIQRDDDLQRTVQLKIMEVVDGMFLLARLYVDSLLDKRTKAKVISKLNELSNGPEALEDAYREVIIRIDSQLPEDRALAKAVLSWISYAQRPLNTAELCHALAVELGDEELDQDNIPEVQDLESVCAGLVTVDEESNIIRLVHFTTQRFLETIREQWNPKAQLNIASTCLTYLCFNTFKSGSCLTDAEFNERLDTNVFLTYAAQYWAQHVTSVQEEVSEIAMCLLQDNNLISSIVQTQERSAFAGTRYLFSQEFPSNRNGLHLAADHGLSYSFGELLRWADQGNKLLIDDKDSNGRTPLSFGAKRGHEAIVQLLIQRREVEINSKSNRHSTPLAGAAMEGHEAVTELLLERDDIDVNLRDFGGMTALSQAAKNGHVAIVKLLLEREDVIADRKDDNRETPLSHAASNGHTTVVELLVKRADVELNQRNMYGMTPLMSAVGNGEETVVKLLLEQDNIEVNAKRHNGKTPLYLAASCGDTDMVTLLLEHGADLGSEAEWPHLPLIGAVKNHSPDVVELLVKWGANIHARSRSGQTPLLLAAGFRRRSVPEVLIKNGAKLDVKDCKGRTPISIAARKGHEKVVKLLLEQGVKIESRDLKSRTPLWWAAKKGHEMVVKLLSEQGADVNAMDVKDQTPLLVAASNGFDEIITMFFNMCGADGNDEGNGHDDDEDGSSSDDGSDYASDDGKEGCYPGVWVKVSRRYQAVIKTLLDHGAKIQPHDALISFWTATDVSQESTLKYLAENSDVKISRKINQTPLSLAAKRGNETLVKLLVNQGAHLESKDWLGRTPLAHAVKNGKEPIVEFLLQRGADVNAKDKHGTSPLCLAARRGRTALAELLLKHGADVDSEKDTGETPLQLAAKTWNEHMINLLLTWGANVNARDHNGLTPLLTVVKAQYSYSSTPGETTSILIEHGADVNSADETGNTALLMAAEKKNKALVKFLLECGANVNAKNQQRVTPLLRAVCKWNLSQSFELKEIIKTLIEYGADAGSEDIRGNTPLLVVRMSREEVQIEFQGKPIDKDEWAATVEPKIEQDAELEDMIKLLESRVSS